MPFELLRDDYNTVCSKTHTYSGIFLSLGEGGTPWGGPGGPTFWGPILGSKKLRFKKKRQKWPPPGINNVFLKKNQNSL